MPKTLQNGRSNQKGVQRNTALSFTLPDGQRNVYKMHTDNEDHSSVHNGFGKAKNNNLKNKTNGYTRLNEKTNYSPRYAHQDLSLPVSSYLDCNMPTNNLTTTNLTPNNLSTNNFSANNFSTANCKKKPIYMVNIDDFPSLSESHGGSKNHHRDELESGGLESNYGFSAKSIPENNGTFSNINAKISSKLETELRIETDIELETKTGMKSGTDSEIDFETKTSKSSAVDFTNKSEVNKIKTDLTVDTFNKIDNNLVSLITNSDFNSISNMTKKSNKTKTNNTLNMVHLIKNIEKNNETRGDNCDIESILESFLAYKNMENTLYLFGNSNFDELIQKNKLLYEEKEQFLHRNLIKENARKEYCPPLYYMTMHEIIKNVKLKPEKFSQEMLFWLFYAHPGEYLQYMAAIHLFYTSWKYCHKYHVWILVFPEELEYNKERLKNGYDHFLRNVLYFDTSSWSIKELTHSINHTDLSDVSFYLEKTKLSNSKLPNLFFVSNRMPYPILCTESDIDSDLF